MNKIILFIFSVFVLTSCKKEKSNTKQETKVTLEKVSEKKIKTRKRIGDYMSDNKDYNWYAKITDSISEYPRLIFQKEFAIYQFHGQCYYWLFTNHYYTGADKIELLWTYKKDCLFEPKSLQSSNGIRKYPKIGDSFCEYTLVNDSVMKVEYKFPEWVKKVNKSERDSIFPQYLYLQRKGSQ